MILKNETFPMIIKIIKEGLPRLYFIIQYTMASKCLRKTVQLHFPQNKYYGGSCYKLAQNRERVVPSQKWCILYNYFLAHIDL